MKRLRAHRSTWTIPVLKTVQEATGKENWWSCSFCGVVFEPKDIVFCLDFGEGKIELKCPILKKTGFIFVKEEPCMKDLSWGEESYYKKEYHLEDLPIKTSTTRE